MSGQRDPGSLRDARLRRALDHAPDAAAVPDAKVRQAVRAAAHEAVVAREAAPVFRERRTPWWRRLRNAWWGAPAGRRPWSAALATVLLAGVITVLWQGQAPVQDDGGVAESPGDLDVAMAPPAAVRQQAPVAAADATMAPPPVAEALPPSPSPAPPAAGKPRPAARSERPTAPVPAPVPAPPPAAGSSAPPVPLPMAWARAWDQAQVLADGAVPAAPADAGRRIRREEAPALADPLAALAEAPVAASPSSSEARRESADTAAEPSSAAAAASRHRSAARPQGEQILRVRLWQGGQPLGVLEVSGSSWRFVPAAPGAAGVQQGPLAPATAQALHDALRHLPPAQADEPAQR